MTPKPPAQQPRRTLLRSALGAGVALSLQLDGARGARAADVPAAAPYKLLPGKPKKALFVYGGWPGHEPEKCRDRFVPWLKSQGLEVVVSGTLDAYLDDTVMRSVDLIVQIWTMGTIAGNQLRGLLEAVHKRGVGIAGWHGGLGDAFRQETEYQFMIGGQWVSHPGGVVTYRVNITDHDDPVTAGLSDFDLKTEQYYMHVDPNNKVLATTKFSGEHAPAIEGATMPVAWKRVYGHGRVFYTSLGHSNSVFDTPQAFEIAKRGILWASRSRYEETPRLVSPRYPDK